MNRELKLCKLGAVFVSMMFMASMALSVRAEVQNFQGMGDSRAEACSNAKYEANNYINNLNMKMIGTRDSITGFGNCDCDRSDYGTYYTCYVDAYVKSESKR